MDNLLKFVLSCSSVSNSTRANTKFLHMHNARPSLLMILNQRRWQSLGWQHDKDVDGLFEKVSFQTAFEGVESG